jgi:hypothetical protein
MRKSLRRAMDMIEWDLYVIVRRLIVAPLSSAGDRIASQIL